MQAANTWPAIDAEAEIGDIRQWTTGAVLARRAERSPDRVFLRFAPDGRSYAVSVMIKRTSTPLVVRMTLMNNVVRAVIDSHASQGTPYTL